MDSVLRHRAFALLFSLLVGMTVASIPALAENGPLEAIMDDYKASSEAKLDWFEEKLAGKAATSQKNRWYEQTLFSLTQNADDTLEQLIIAAGSDPILLAQIPDLVEELAEMEKNFLQEAEQIYNSHVEPVVTTTSTLPVITTTTLQLPPITTTTRPAVTTTSTSTTTSSTTTTTVPAVMTTTTRPAIGSATAAAPPPASGGSGGSGGDVALTQAPSATGGVTGEVASQVLSASAAVSAQLPRSQFLFNVEPSEVVSAHQMLIPYEPANLPSRLPAPVTSFLAVLQMVLGAFLSSFRQIGGPATAGAFYLGYEVWRHLRSKVPGGLPA